MFLNMMSVKRIIDFFESSIIPCATAADMKSTKAHVQNVQAQIQKNKNYKYKVQTHVHHKNTKWEDYQLPIEV